MALREFRKELEMREVVARTPLCPWTKCSECPICEKKVDELERNADSELEFLFLKMRMYE